MTPTEIWTDRLMLRAAEMHDLPFFHKWFSDPESMKYWSTPPFTSIEQTKEYLERMTNSSTSKYNGYMEFAICLTTASDAGTITGTGTGDSGFATTTELDESGFIVIGKAGLWDGKEIGYIIDRDYWGKGYAFEAIDAILKHVWSLDPSEAPKVVLADVDPENVASIRLLQKLGFVQVGEEKHTYETHLGWRDSVFFEARKPIDLETGA